METHAEPAAQQPSPQQPQQSQHPLEQTLYQVKKTIVGQDQLLQRMLVALLARGHILVEGVPGLANPSQQGFFVGIGFAVPIATAGGGAGAPAQ